MIPCCKIGDIMDYEGESYDVVASDYGCEIKIGNKTEKCAFYNNKKKCQNIPCGSCVNYDTGEQMAFKKRIKT